MATYTSNYAWTKPSGGDPVDIEVLNDNLDDQDSIVHQAFLDLAPVFSTANTYAVKDVVLYDNKVWICHTAVTTAGAWTGSTNWTQTTVGETGGVATYADLPDKPSINGNELSGDKTGAQLGLQNTLTFDNVPTANSTNPVKSGGVYSADEAIRKWTTAEAKSVSGNPITLTDGSARKAEGLAVTCNPKQNLHGYDHPWAGGAGKNKLPMTVANLKAINTNGTWSGNAYTVNSVTYTILTDSDNNVIGFAIDGKAQNGNATLYLFKGDMSSLSNVILNGCPQGGSNNTYNIFAQLMSSPYTIYGRDTGSGVSIASMSATTQIVIVVFENIELSHSKFYPMIRLASVSDATFEPYTNECPITGYTECVVAVKDEDETTQDTATIAFGQTVYGGSVDFKTGKVTVTHGIVDLGGLTWSTQTTNVSGKYRFRTGDIVLVDKKPPANNVIANIICSNYKAITAENTYLLNEQGVALDTAGAVLIYDATKDTLTAEQFKTAMDGVHLCYELATPTELTLTSAELELLKGYNYITTNGTTIALAYLPDSLLAEAENYVDAKIPPAPTTNGTYVLTCTVTSGTPVYSWESAT